MALKTPDYANCVPRENFMFAVLDFGGLDGVNAQLFVLMEF